MRSADGGYSWCRVGIDQGSHSVALVRCLINVPGRPETVVAGAGIPSTAALFRSTDGGNNWESPPLPVQPSSAMWVVKMQPSDQEMVFAGSRYVCLYHSQDGGKHGAR